MKPKKKSGTSSARCCMVCQLEFKNRDDRNNHEIKNHFFDEMCCYEGCFFAINWINDYKKSRSRLKGHIENVHLNLKAPSTIYTERFSHLCVVCGESFPHKAMMLKHESTIHFPGYKKCTIGNCNWSVEKGGRRTSAIFHYKTKHQLLEGCWECNMYFKTKQERKEHSQHCQLKKKKKEDKIYTCAEPGCDYTCGSANSIRSHCEVYHSDKVYRCDQCDFSCKWAASLYRHKRTVHGKKKYRCTVCEQEFTQGCSVTRHMKTAHSSVPDTATEVGKKRKASPAESNKKKKRQYLSKQ